MKEGQGMDLVLVDSRLDEKKGDEISSHWKN